MKAILHLTTPVQFSIVLIFLFTCLVSCDEDDIIQELENPAIDIGTYELLPESIAMLPYLNKHEIVFVDSLQNQAVFEISEADLFSGSVTIFKYNVVEEGDTVRYTYMADSKSFYISNDSLDMNFNIDLKSKPYYRDPESQTVADVLDIFCRLDTPQYSARQVFYHVTNPRSWPMYSITPSIEELEIYNRTFYYVMKTDFVDPKSVVRFNYEFGIISFTDKTDRLWRFDSMN